MTLRRLKRRRLVREVYQYPDKSADIVTALAAYAYEMHAYLGRRAEDQE